MALTGNITLGLQAIDDQNNVLFNRKIDGLTNATCTGCATVNDFKLSLDPINLEAPNGTLIGFYIKNLDAEALLDCLIVFSDDSSSHFSINPGDTYLCFNSIEAHDIHNIQLTSNKDGSLINYAYWQ